MEKIFHSYLELFAYAFMTSNKTCNFSDSIDVLNCDTSDKATRVTAVLRGFHNQPFATDCSASGPSRDCGNRARSKLLSPQ